MSDRGRLFNKRLVRCVQRHPILYDSSHTNFYNVEQQEVTWQNVAQELDENAGFCKMKWRNIKDCFRRFLRQGKIVKKKYYLYNELMFLLPFYKRKSALSEAIDDITEEDEEVRFSSNVNVETTLMEINKVETTHFESEPDAINNDESFGFNERTFDPPEIKYDEEMEDVKPYFNDDANMSFFKSLLPDLKRMNSKQLSKCKIMILNNIHTILYDDNNIIN